MAEAAGSIELVDKAGKRTNRTLRQTRPASVMATSGFKMINKAARVGALAVIATGAAALHMATDFDQAMTLVRTQAGAPAAEVAKLRGEVLKLSDSVPQGPLELAKGLYHVESIGLRGSKAMTALKVAAEGAMVGQANLESTTTALGSAWLSGIKGAGSLRHTMALLNATVGAGNMRMDDLVTALGTGILPSAKLAGLSITDVMGALAILSDEGYQSSSAMAQLATAFHFLYAPTMKATNALQDIGLGQLDLARTMRTKGLVAALTLLRNHLNMFSRDKNKQAQILSAIIPGGRGRTLLVLMNQLTRYQQKINQITHTTGNFNKAVDQQRKTVHNQLEQAWSRLQHQLILVGHALQPVLLTALHAAVAVLGFLAQHATATAIAVGILVAAIAGFYILKTALVLWDKWSTALRIVKDLCVGTRIQLLALWAVEKLFGSSAADAAAAGVQTLGAKISGLTGRIIGMLKYAGPVAAFLGGLGVFNPDAAGLTPQREGSMLKQARQHARGYKAHLNTLATAMGLTKNVSESDAAGVIRAAVANTGGPSTWTKQARTWMRQWFKSHGERGIPGLAMGGVVRLPGAVLVGEQGPELLNLDAGARVDPLPQTRMPRTPTLGKGDVEALGDFDTNDFFRQEFHLYIDGREVAVTVRKKAGDDKARR